MVYHLKWTFNSSIMNVHDIKISIIDIVWPFYYLAFHVFYALCILIVNDKLTKWFSSTWRKPFLFFIPCPITFSTSSSSSFFIYLNSVAHEYIYLFEVKRNELMFENFSFSNNNNNHYYDSIVWRPLFLWHKSFSKCFQFDGTWWSFWIPQNAPGVLNEYKMNKIK